VAVLALGEGWHNYHHVFPWDYKTAELGNYRYNITTAFIDFFKWVGWAYDLKTVPVSVIEKRVKRTGDGTHEVWGWGDKDMSSADVEEVLHLGKKDD
jgi:stearoyl-CoA desaturase (delta-9 desaturase)